MRDLNTVQGYQDYASLRLHLCAGTIDSAGVAFWMGYKEGMQDILDKEDVMSQLEAAKQLAQSAKGHPIEEAYQRGRIRAFNTFLEV